MFWPCETRTSTCRSFATISSGLYRFLAIAVLLDVKDIPQVGPLQWGWIRRACILQERPQAPPLGPAIRFNLPCRPADVVLLVQLSGRNNRNASMTGTSPRASVSDTRVWQLEVSRIVGVQLEIALYEFYEGQLLLQESLRLMNDLGFVPAIIDPIVYYDATDPCRLMEMDGVFIRRRHPT